MVQGRGHAAAHALRPVLPAGGGGVRRGVVRQVHPLQRAGRRAVLAGRRPRGHEPPGALRDPGAGRRDAGFRRRPGRRVGAAARAAAAPRGAPAGGRAAVRPHGSGWAGSDPDGHPGFRHRRARALRQPPQRPGGARGGRPAGLRLHQLELQQPRQHRFRRPHADGHRPPAVRPGLPLLPELHGGGGPRPRHDRGAQPLRVRRRAQRARGLPRRRGQPRRRGRAPGRPLPGRGRCAFPRRDPARDRRHPPAPGAERLHALGPHRAGRRAARPGRRVPRGAAVLRRRPAHGPGAVHPGRPAARPHGPGGPAVCQDLGRHRPAGDQAHAAHGQPDRDAAAGGIAAR